MPSSAISVPQESTLPADFLLDDHVDDFEEANVEEWLVMLGSLQQRLECMPDGMLLVGVSQVLVDVYY